MSQHQQSGDIFTRHIQPVPRGAASARATLLGWIASAAAARRRSRLRRQTVRELQKLDERLLRDIGIPRSQIWAVAEHLVNAPGTRSFGRDHREPAAPAQEPPERRQPRASQSTLVPATVGCG